MHPVPDPVPDPQRSHRRRVKTDVHLRLGRRLTTAALCCVAACGPTSAGDAAGCAGAGTNAADNAYPEPPYAGGEILPDVVRARVTQAALDAVGDYLADVLPTFLPVENGRVVYYLNESLLPAGSPVVFRDGCLGEPAGDHCAVPTDTSQVSFDLNAFRDRLQLVWLPPDASGRPGIRLLLTDLEIFVDLVMALHLPGVLPPAACHLYDMPNEAAVRLNGLGADVRLAVSTADGSAPPTIAANLENVTIDLGNTGENIVSGLITAPCDGSAGAGGAAACIDATCFDAGANCQEVCSLLDLFSELGGFLGTILEPILDGLAPTLADALTAGVIDSLGQLPLAFAGELNPSELLGETFQGFQPIFAGIEASSALDARPDAGGTRGLDISFHAGLTTPPSRCTFGALPPDFASFMGPAPIYSGYIQVADADGGSHPERYHLAASISQASLEQLAWTIFQGGITCFNLDAEEIEAVAGSAFTFTAGLLMSFDAALNDVTNADAPMLAAVRASGPPRIRLGTGRTLVGGEFDPLITVNLDQLHLGLYMMFEDSQLLVSDMTTDLEVALSIERSIEHTPNQNLVLVVDHISIANTEQIYNELAPAANLTELLELVVDMALGNLLGDSLRFEFDVGALVSDAMGLPVEVRFNAVRRDLGPTGTPHLSAYVTMCNAEQVADPTDPVCYRPPPGSTSATPAGCAATRSEASTPWLLTGVGLGWMWQHTCRRRRQRQRQRRSNRQPAPPAA